MVACDMSPSKEMDRDGGNLQSKMEVKFCGCYSKEVAGRPNCVEVIIGCVEVAL